MKYETKICISRSMLNRASKETVTVTAKFENGYEADIKLVRDADCPYIDPVLFDENGFEICCLQDESNALEGVYQFDVGENTFIVEVEVVKEASK